MFRTEKVIITKINHSSIIIFCKKYRDSLETQVQDDHCMIWGKALYSNLHPSASIASEIPSNVLGAENIPESSEKSVGYV